MESKLTTLKSAVSRFVTDGCHLSIGGFTLNRNPMAAVYEIIRQKIRNIHLYAHSNGQGVDELIGSRCINRLDIAYAGNGRYAPTCIRFRKAVEQGDLLVEDYSNFQMTLRFLAGAMGIPFMPVNSSFHTDISDKWGFSETLRNQDERLPNQKMVPLKNPFGNWCDTDNVMLVPAINPDVTIIHAQKADEYGTVRLEGLPFSDIEQAKSARHLIVTCEELSETEELRKTPDRNSIPFFLVDAVVHVPWGAYPTACYNHYDYDPEYLKLYKTSAGDNALHKRHMEKTIHEYRSFQDFRKDKITPRMETLMADPVKGYATGLSR